MNLKNLLCFLLTLCCLQAAGPARAQGNELWFTIMGNLADEEADTVQLNMAKVGERGKIDLMQLRVNLSQQRTMDGGEKYQSYLSKILIDCKNDSIVQLEQTRFASARWQGSSNYQVFSEVRPMAFRGLEPNPKSHVLRAACAENPAGAPR